MKFKERSVSIFLVLVMLLCAAPVYAATVQISCINAPTNVMDVNNAGFSVTIYNTSFASSEYTVSYSVSDKSGSQKINAQAYRNTVTEIKLPGLEKGVHELSVTVTDSYGAVSASLDTTIGITKFYEKKPMDEYSRVSMSTHMLFNAQTDATEVSLMPKIGILKNRDEIYWSTVEPLKEKWSFDRSDSYMNILADNDMDTFIIMDYSNNRYVLTDKNGNNATDKIAPRTAEEMEGFTRYVQNTLKRYPQIKTIEVWNEPNWGFWEPEPDSIDYAAMVKAVSAAAREVRPDIYIIAGSLVYVGYEEFLNDMIDEGVLPYIDAVSSHPYSFPYGSDNVLEGKLQSVNNIIFENGGFKEHVISEVGLPTSANERGASEEKQASEMIKIFAYNDENGISLTNWYNFRDKGSDPLDEEHNYGILNRDYTPKKALIALSNFNNKLNGSIYFGSVKLSENVSAYLYLRDGKVTALVWSKGAEEAVSIDCGYAEDIFGNTIEAIAKNEPVYLCDVGEDILLSSLKNELSAIYNEFDLLWQKNMTGTSSTEEWLNMLSDTETNVTPFKVADMIALHENTRIEILNIIYRKNPNAAMTMLDCLKKAVERLAAYYGYLNGEKFNSVSVSEADSTKMPDTGAVLKYAKRNAEMLETAENSGSFEGKQTAVGYYSALGRVYSAWASELYRLEERKEYTDVFLYPKSTDMTIYRGRTENAEVSVVNKENEDVSCRIAVRDEDGKQVSCSEILKLSCGESKTIILPVSVPLYEREGEKKYTLCAENDKSDISRRGIRVNVKSERREYDCFDALKFEDKELLSITDRYGSVEYISDGEGIYEVNSGNGAIYVNSNGNIKITAVPNSCDVIPKDGDFIDGEYYLKVTEQIPTDWRQPIIRLYGMRGSDKILLAEPENLNSYSVWETKRFEWNKLKLKSTGVPYSSDMKLVCEITVGIGANGGLKFMLDDISYYSALNENDDGLEKTYGVPKINEADFDGSFESSQNGGFPGGWGMYVPNKENDGGIDAFEASADFVWHGSTSMKVNRGGSMWHIESGTGGFEDKIIGGSYMLYVPEGANFKHNYPRVWVEYVLDGVTYTAAQSPKNISEYPLKTGWNRIPICCMGLKIPKRAERINLMLEAPNIIDGNVINRPYTEAFYLDDIRIGDIIEGVYISKNSSASVSQNGTQCNFVLTNTKSYDRIKGGIIAAVYKEGKLISCDMSEVSMRGKGSFGQQSILYKLNCENTDNNVSVKFFFMDKDFITPICESLTAEFE